MLRMYSEMTKAEKNVFAGTIKFSLQNVGGGGGGERRGNER